MPDALKRSLALFLVFALAFLSVYLFRAWQGGHPIFGFGEKPDDGQFVTENATLASEPPLQEDEVPGLVRQNNEMTKLVEKVTPSVVSIDIDIVKPTIKVDPFTNELRRGYRLTPGLGSGVIVSEEGHVITNHHVIEGYQRIRVTLHNGRSLPARLIASDELLDIAVLRLRPEDGEKFIPLKFADSDLVKVGQLAIAIGNPFGLGESVTVGHISARDRSYSDKDRDMFQTDAAINPGNSGGPLLNHLGEIIAINASIFTKERDNPSFQGIGFSIPANDVKRSFNYICEKGRPVYGYLGLSVAPLNSYLRSVFAYQGEGILIKDVMPDSPADKAGVRPNDIITAYNGEGVSTPDEFLTRLRRTIVGTEGTVSLQRGDKIVNLTATIGEVDPYEPATKEEGRRLASDQAILTDIGIEVQNTHAHFQTQRIYGVVVTRILPDSIGAARGVRPGDIILDVNEVRVRHPTDFYFRIVASAAVQATRIKLIRNKVQEIDILLPQVPRTD